MIYPSREEMSEELLKNGWISHWNEDNWIKKDYPYSNPDMAGVSMEEAYNQVTEYKLQKLFDILRNG